MDIKVLFTVFIGGGLGSITRFLLAKWVNTWHTHHFPFGTLVVNIVACWVLGLVVGLADHRQVLSPMTRVFWAVGFCGGFSTFSTFSNETLGLLQQGQSMSTLLYIMCSVFFCVLATFGGIFVAGKI
jgi:fluoride exporter